MGRKRPLGLGASLGRRTIRKMIREQGGKCALCGEALPDTQTDCRPDDRPTIDHIIPRSKFGPDNRWNLQITHLRCNQDKADTMPPLAEVQRAVVGCPQSATEKVKKKARR